MAKTKNKSIRFDVEHLKYAFEKTGLTKEQELVDKVLADLYAAGNMSENLFIGKLNPIEFKEGVFTTNDAEVIEVMKSRLEDKPTYSQIENRIKELEKEIAKPPATIKIGKKAWLAIREKELDELKNELADAKV